MQMNVQCQVVKKHVRLCEVLCCTQSHESTTVREFFFAVRGKENKCREQLAWHGLEEDGS